MMKHSSCQFGDSFSEFGRQSEKCSRIGACIRSNFTPENDILRIPLTPISDQDRISPYSINTVSSRQVMRIKKNINKGNIG